MEFVGRIISMKYSTNLNLLKIKEVGIDTIQENVDGVECNWSGKSDDLFI